MKVKWLSCKGLKLVDQEKVNALSHFSVNANVKPSIERRPTGVKKQT